MLELIASDPGAQQAELVLLGLFGRAVRLIAASAANPSTPSPELTELCGEAEALVALLKDRHAQLCVSLENPEGGFPELRSSVWQAPAPAQAAVQTLLPQMTENRRKVRDCGARVVISALCNVCVCVCCMPAWRQTHAVCLLRCMSKFTVARLLCMFYCPCVSLCVCHTG